MIADDWILVLRSELDIDAKDIPKKARNRLPKGQIEIGVFGKASMM